MLRTKVISIKGDDQFINAIYGEITPEEVMEIEKNLKVNPLDFEGVAIVTWDWVDGETQYGSGHGDIHRIPGYWDAVKIQKDVCFLKDCIGNVVENLYDLPDLNDPYFDEIINDFIIEAEHVYSLFNNACREANGIENDF